MANRFSVMIASGASFVLTLFAFYFLFAAWAQYRYPDFSLASDQADFSRLGTCVSEISNDQLKAAGYDSQERDKKDCNADGDADGNGLGLQARYANSLAASVHGLYWSSVHPTPTTPHWVGVVAESVITATVGKMLDPALYTDAAMDGLYRPSLNETYAALHGISGVPTTCDRIYFGIAEAASGKDAGQFDEDKIVKPKTRCYFNDASVKDEFVDVTDSGRSTTPITDFSTVASLLHAHCVKQFSYARRPRGGHLLRAHPRPRVARAGPTAFPYGPVRGWNVSVASFDSEWPVSSARETSLLCIFTNAPCFAAAPFPPDARDVFESLSLRSVSLCVRDRTRAHARAVLGPHQPRHPVRLLGVGLHPHVRGDRLLLHGRAHPLRHGGDAAIHHRQQPRGGR